LPKDQELVPNSKPEARSDLEALQRLAIEQISAALGVPASLVFEGRFSANSSSQLTLLNSTVSELAKSVNQVLTSVYISLYPDEEKNPIDGRREERLDTNVELKLRTAPLAASQEIVGLFGAGLIDVEIATPAVLHSLGASSDEIDAALARMKEKVEKETNCANEDRELEVESKKIGLDASKLTLKQQKEAPRGERSGSGSGSGNGSGSGGGSGSGSV
jgi:uncharacterized membrane protein YgcG